MIFFSDKNGSNQNQKEEPDGTMTLLEVAPEITINLFPNQKVTCDTSSDLKQAKSQVYTSDIMSLLM